MQWLVFSRLELPKAKSLCEALGAKLVEFLEYSGKETEWSSSASARGPKGTQRPEGTNSVLAIEADPETDPIAATLLRLLIEQSDPIEVDWGTRQPADEVLEMLGEFDVEPSLLGDDGGSAESAEEEGEDLFERVLEAVLAASEDMERSAELKEAIREASPLARAWMEHVVKSNVRSDASVDDALGLSGTAAERVHREIEAMLAELAE
jgi:hypothetical protein